jgi:hypothetical protein
MNTILVNNSGGGGLVRFVAALRKGNLIRLRYILPLQEEMELTGVVNTGKSLD